MYIIYLCVKLRITCNKLPVVQHYWFFCIKSRIKCALLWGWSPWGKLKKFRRTVSEDRYGAAVSSRADPCYPGEVALRFSRVCIPGLMLPLMVPKGSLAPSPALQRNICLLQTFLRHILEKTGIFEYILYEIQNSLISLVCSMVLLAHSFIQQILTEYLHCPRHFAKL